MYSASGVLAEITEKMPEGNKNLIKHNVTNEECEEIFFDQRKVIMKDVAHSKSEERYTLIGQTKKKPNVRCCIYYKKK